jgi:hypothetical protein
LFNNLLNRYVAIWNEPDAAVRRAGVAELWAPEGLHYTQTRKFRGIDELDARVTEAYDQFVAGSGLLFVSENNLVVHHNVAKFNWDMVQHNGDLVAVGFDFLILDPDGRILVDYQFNEPPVPSPELDELAERYLAVGAEADEDQRRKSIEELYADQACLVDESAEHLGHDAIVVQAAAGFLDLSANGLVRRLTGHASAQHNAVRFNWQIEPAAGGPVVATGFEFLVRGEDNLIRADYRFTD